MPLYRPKELQAFLESEHLRPLKSLSQNFLIDGNILEKIVQMSHLREGEPVLEIGPGPGVFTERLSSLMCPTLSIEKDAGFAARIERFNGVIGHHADALKVDLGRLVRAHLSPTRSIPIFANLPYRSTSAFIRKLLTCGSWARSLTCMIPQAVFAKLQGVSGAHWLHIATRIFSNHMHAHKVSRHCFTPLPSCDSVLVHWNLAAPLSETEGQAFLQWLALRMRGRQARSIKQIISPGHYLAEWNGAHSL